MTSVRRSRFGPEILEAWKRLRIGHSYAYKSFSGSSDGIGDKMIKSIELENFKCFGERVKIPLAPITLIYGQNSAGKSSILQALYALKQTLVLAPPSVPLLLRSDGGLIDLGGFADVVHDHQVNTAVGIGVRLAKNEKESNILCHFVKLARTIQIDDILLGDSHKQYRISKVS